MDFDAHILKFALFLRKAGISVSSSEVQDCIDGIRHADLSKAVFYQVLRSTLIKDQASFGTFDHAFNLYFSSEFLSLLDCKSTPHQGGGFEDIGPLNEVAGERCQCIPDHGPNWGLGQGAGTLGRNSNRFVQIIRVGDSGQCTDYINEGIKSLGKLTREHLDNMKETLRKVKVYLEWNMGLNLLAKEAEKTNNELWWVWQSRVAELENLLRKSLGKELSRCFGEEALGVILETENLNKLDFYKLNDNQVEEIKRKISRLGHRLATRLSYRTARSKKGFVDIQKTIKRAVSSGGIPIKLAHKDRVPSKPEIWVLCDLSGSVKRLSEFMLQLTYSFQSRFVNVRSFVFVDTLAEATECFRKGDIEEGIREIYNNLSFSKTGFSDYREVFKDLLQEYGQELNKKISLIIIGDAKNNYRPEGEEYLIKISKEVRRILWLNPYAMELWNDDDSVMKVYIPYCSRVFECRNLKQLERIARTTFFSIY